LVGEFRGKPDRLGREPSGLVLLGTLALVLSETDDA
jgi:hypothetical protein